VELADETVVDGEVVALDATGRAWGRRPDGEKMAACRWLRPELVAAVE